jgi:hypothetical protein
MQNEYSVSIKEREIESAKKDEAYKLLEDAKEDLQNQLYSKEQKRGNA